MISYYLSQLKKIESVGEDLGDEEYLHSYLMHGALYQHSSTRFTSAAHFFEQKPSLWRRVFYELCLKASTENEIPKKEKPHFCHILVTTILSTVDQKITEICKKHKISCQNCVEETLGEFDKIGALLAVDELYHNACKSFKKSDKKDELFVFFDQVTRLEEHLRTIEEAYSELMSFSEDLTTMDEDAVLENMYSAMVTFELVYDNPLLLEGPRSRLKERMKRCRDYAYEVRADKLCKLSKDAAKLLDDASINSTEKTQKIAAFVHFFQICIADSIFAKNFKIAHPVEWYSFVYLCQTVI